MDTYYLLALSGQTLADTNEELPAVVLGETPGGYDFSPEPLQNFQLEIALQLVQDPGGDYPSLTNTEPEENDLTQFTVANAFDATTGGRFSWQLDIALQYSLVNAGELPFTFPDGLNFLFKVTGPSDILPGQPSACYCHTDGDGFVRLSLRYESKPNQALNLRAGLAIGSGPAAEFWTNLTLAAERI